MKSRGIASLVAGWMGLSAVVVSAQVPAPRLDAVFPSGGTIGATAEITVAGGDLDGVAALHFSHSGIRSLQTQRDGALGKEPVSRSFRVEIDASLPPGLYDVRLSNRLGVSNPRVFAVSREASISEVEPNDTPDKALAIELPRTVDGRIERATDTDCVRFAGKEGQRVVVDCRARRIDSLLEAVVVLSDGDGREIVRSRPGARQDASLDVVLPAAGEYTVRVFDRLYRGGGEYPYRLTVTSDPQVEFVLPAAVAPNQTSRVTVYGRNLPGGRPSKMSIDGAPELDAVDVEIKAPESAPSAATRRGAKEFAVDRFVHAAEFASFDVGLALAPVLLEVEPNDDRERAQPVTLPVDWSGTFYPRGDVDWLRFEAEKGQVSIIDVFCDRLGVTSDVYFVVEQVIGDGEETKAKEVGRVDDVGAKLTDGRFNTSTTDPTLRFVAPETGTYRLALRDHDSASRSDPRAVYRVVIRPEAPDFRLVAATRTPELDKDKNKNLPRPIAPVLRRGAALPIDVFVARQDGFGGAITLRAEDLPKGVTCDPTTVLPGSNSATLMLRAGDDVEDAAATLRIVGQARVGDRDVERAAESGTVVWPAQANVIGVQSRLADGFTIGTTASEPAPVRFELAADRFAMSRAGKLELPFRLATPFGRKGNLSVEVTGLPSNVSAKGIDIGDKASDGKLVVEIKENAPVGEWPLVFKVRGQIRHELGKELVGPAETQRAELEKETARVAAALEEAKSASASAEKTLADAQSAFDEAEKNVRELTDQLVQVAMRGDTSEEAKKKVRASADTLATTAESRGVARAALDAARTKLEAAAKALADAEPAAARTAQLFEAAKKRHEELKKAAEPKDRRICSYSAPVVLAIEPSPVAVAVSREIAVSPTEKASLAVKIDKKYGFDDAVEIAVKLPKDSKGLAVAAGRIEKGAAETAVEISTTAESVGAIEAEVVATVTFGGKKLVTSAPLRIVIQPKEPQEVAEQ